MDAAAAPRSKEASSPSIELHPAVQEARHEGVAGADCIDHLGGKARHPRDVAARLDSNPATWTERDHCEP